MKSDCTDEYGAERIPFMCLNAISAMLSLFGSSAIIYIILSGGWTKLCRVHNRFLLGISVIDVLYSIAMGLSFIPSPHRDDCSYGFGNELTCTTQGFFLMLGSAVPGYNMMLSIYYVATIVSNTPEETIAQTYEPYMHIYAILPALSGALIGAANAYYFSQRGQCWIGDPCHPAEECGGVDAYGDGQWLVIASISWMVFNTFGLYCCLLIIYSKVRGRVVAMRRYTFHNVNRGSSQIEQAAHESALQALLYIAAYTLTYGWSFVDIICHFINGDKPRPVLYILMSIFLPLQGFWNFLAYIRPRFVLLRKEQETTLSYFSTVHMIIFGREEVLPPTPLPATTMARRGSTFTSRPKSVHIPSSYTYNHADSSSEDLGYSEKDDISPKDSDVSIQSFGEEMIDL